MGISRRWRNLDRRVARFALVLLVALAAPTAAAGDALKVAPAGSDDIVVVPAVSEDLQVVLDCMAKNLPKESSSQHFAFESRDKNGGGRSVDGRITWKRFDDGKPRALLRVHGPPDLKGAGLLLVEKEDQSDIFVYLPDLKKVRRINSRSVSGRIFGSDFTYEDFRHLQGMADKGTRERLPDSELDGVAVHVLASYPQPDSGSAYERVVSYVETERCIPLKSEMYEPGGRLKKVLIVDRNNVFEQDGVRIPADALMRDLIAESSTRLVIEDVELERRISRNLFSTSSLQRPRVD